MFGLLYNFYKFCKKKSERKITLAVLGLDNAGKTTLLNSIKGEVEQETTPTFGFNSSTLQEGKYKIEVFDLGGSKTFRSVWSRYLAEVHAIVYVVDAADAQRFEESKKALNDVLECQHMRDKAVLVFANKQDLPTASTAAEVVKGLGLATCRNSHNVFPCTAKTPKDAPVDERLREGLRWLTGLIDREFGRLDGRVQAETAEVRQEEARKQKEREERLRQQREERLRQQKEEEERAREVERENALHNGQGPALLTIPNNDNPVELQSSGQPAESEPEGGKAQALLQGMVLGLPHTIESPGKLPLPRQAIGTPASDVGPSGADQGPAASTGACDGGLAASRSGPSAVSRSSYAARPSSAQSRASEGAVGAVGGSANGGAGTASSSAPTGRPPSAGRASGCGSGCSSPGRPASGGSRAAGAVAEGSDEALGSHSQRPRSGNAARGIAAAAEGPPRGSFSLVTQNNKVVPVVAGIAEVVAA